MAYSKSPFGGSRGFPSKRFFSDAHLFHVIFPCFDSFCHSTVFRKLSISFARCESSFFWTFFLFKPLLVFIVFRTFAIAMPTDESTGAPARLFHLASASEANVFDTADLQPTAASVF